jgi:formylglycine-generating enzyme required for sulfatase activity
MDHDSYRDSYTRDILIHWFLGRLELRLTTSPLLPLPSFKQGENQPVVCINRDDAKAYVAWLSKKTGKTYRLLSEAEWEYAARAGTTTPFSTGRTITTDQANFNGNCTYNGSGKGQYRQKTVSVGSFPANAFGLHDMHGNVYEWVEDCWKDNYRGAPSNGSAWTTGNCSRHVLRGGSWNFRQRNLRSANRSRFLSVNRYDLSGLRVARTL